MTTEISPTVPANGLLASLQERSPRRITTAGIRGARREAHHLIRDGRAATERYRGGVPAELQALSTYRADLQVRHKEARKSARVAVLSRTGRKISLLGMLSLLRSDGSPQWAIADPRKTLDSRNGLLNTSGWFYWGGAYLQFDTSNRLSKDYMPSGIPALPKRVRELIRDPKINRRAAKIGVLYEPATWTEVHPDPALVVEWKDLPGQYFALAVWGQPGERARIMEWVN